MPAPGKKRYQITLTQETVERFQALEKEFNMPQGSMSNVLDDSLRKVTDTISRLKGKGRATFADLLMMVGEEIDDALQEEKAHDAKAVQKGKAKKGR